MRGKLFMVNVIYIIRSDLKLNQRKINILRETLKISALDSKFIGGSP